MAAGIILTSITEHRTRNAALVEIRRAAENGNADLFFKLLNSDVYKNKPFSAWHYLCDTITLKPRNKTQDTDSIDLYIISKFIKESAKDTTSLSYIIIHGANSNNYWLIDEIMKLLPLEEKINLYNYFFKTDGINFNLPSLVNLFKEKYPEVCI